MKVCIGITTYNRIEILERMASSLLLSKNIDECNIRIYDDQSTEFGYNELNKIFYNAKEIVVRKKNLGADRNMRQMFIDFIATDDDYLFVADSDLIFNPNWYIFFKENSDLDVLSLYNSVTHLNIHQNCNIESDEIITKNHIGAAGTIFKRHIVKDIIDSVPASRSYDWDWSRYLTKKNIKINVSNRSYVQHIGVEGTNNNGSNIIDFGLNFFPGNEINEIYVLDFFQKALISKDLFIRSKLKHTIVLRKTKSLIKIMKWKINFWFEKL